MTFLMTDVEGSTRRWESNPPAMGAAVVALDQVVLDKVSLHRGQLIKERGEGDSHFAVFPGAADAVICAISLQEELDTRAWPEVGSLRIRMALHTGEAEVRHSDYYGPAVNRCARIRSAGHGGQILISQATQRLVKAHLPETIEIRDLGRHRLKDLLHPERLFQITVPGLQSEFPPLKTLDEVRHNLPVQLSSFVGRMQEIADIKDLVLNKRLVTLTGTGGNGKTRLSLQVGAEIVDQFPDGVWFVPLASVADESLLARQIAEELKLPPDDDPLSTVENHFETWQALLILDNCEQIVKGASQLARRLLDSCPDLSILATSREPLGVVGEQVYRTPTLAYSLDGVRPTADALSTLDAPRLLAERTRDRGLPNLLTDSQANAVALLCKRLDGIPLAIEQAAANLDIHTPEQLLAKLEQHFAMRGLEDAGVEERHRTVDATIDWSYQMLSPQERELFGRLAVFVDGWSLDAARAVCSGDGILESEADTLLANLVRKSLVFVAPTPWDDRRFRLLEAVRQYLEERHRPSESLAQKHFSYFRGLAQESLAQLVGPDQGHWAQLMEAEHQNLRSALAWAQDHGCSMEMAVAMRRFWLRIGFAREGLIALRHAVEHERSDDTEVEGHAFNALGACAYKLEELGPAQRYYEESMRRWQETGRADLEAAVLHNLALVAIQLGDRERALDYLQRSFEINESQGNTAQAASALLSMGTYQLQFGNYDQAETQLAQAAHRFRHLGDSYFLAQALGQLADVHFHLRRRAKAREEVREALTIWENVHDPYSLGTCLLCLADVAAEEGRPAAAASLANSAEHILREAEATMNEYLDERHNRVHAYLQSELPPTEADRLLAEARFATLDRVVQNAQNFCTSLAITEQQS